MKHNFLVDFPLLKRGSSLISPILYSRRTISRSAMSIPRAMTIEELQALSEPTFSKNDFRDVKWVGVFGSFAQGKQTEQSDVDIVIHRRKLKEPTQPIWYLEELLPRVWNRSVDIIYVRNSSKEFQYGGYVMIEALLCSQTIYGSSRDEEVIQLRQKAWEILNTAEERFTNMVDMIKEIREAMKGMSEEEFLASTTLQQSVLSQITSLFNVLDSMPQGHVMQDAFYYVIFEKVEIIRKKIYPVQDANTTSTDSPKPCYWKVVWQVTTQSVEGTIDNLARRIKKFCFPWFEDTRKNSKYVQQLNPAEFYNC